MNKKLFNIIFFYFVIVVGMQMASCNKLIEIDRPKNEIMTDEVFSNDKAAQLSINGLYTQMINSSFATYLVNILCSLSGDNLDYFGPAIQYHEFANNTLENSNSYLSSLWSYSLIYQSNSIIENNRDNQALSEKTRDKAIGTAKFVRAFYYFYLVNMFGSVPLILSTGYTKTSLQARTPIDDIYKQIIMDLNDAVSLLPALLTGEKTKISSLAAKAFLAKVYLYSKDWENAKKFSNEVINSGMVHLDSDINKVFLANSSEAIWQLAPQDGIGYIQEEIILLPFNQTVIPTYQISKNLYSSFEDGDKRQENWINYSIIDGEQYFYPFKYKVRTNSTVPTEYQMVFRLGEQYLIRAEAEAELNDIPGALKNVDMIRNRAGLTLFSSDGVQRSRDEVLRLIENERRHELFCEWGSRWFDIKRTGRSDEVFGKIKPNWRSECQLFPIYYYQIIYNKNLVQNPGYD